MLTDHHMRGIMAASSDVRPIFASTAPADIVDSALA